MREIKFRACAPDDKKMGISFDLHEELAPSDFATDRGTWLPETIFMQYTGLKDKNGVEIYEGDIIKHYWEAENEDGFEYVPVFYDSDCAMFKAGDHTLYLEEYAEDGEVIGNIYENPELLEAKS